MTQRQAAGLLLVAAVLWSTAGVLLKSVEAPALGKSGARSLVAAVVIAIWLGRPQITGHPAQLGAAVAYAGTVTLFVIANEYTTAANAIFLQYTSTIYVALLGHWWLKERTALRDWAYVAVALGGVALFFADRLDTRGLWGIVAALGSGMCFAVLVVLLRWQRDASPASSLLLGNLLTAAIGLPALSGTHVSGHDLWLLAALGVFQLGVPYILYAIAIRRVTALEAIFIPMVEPILNPIWVALVTGERPGPWSLAGGALVIGSVLLRGLGKSREITEPPG